MGFFFFFADSSTTIATAADDASAAVSGGGASAFGEMRILRVTIVIIISNYFDPQDPALLTQQLILIIHFSTTHVLGYRFAAMKRFRDGWVEERSSLPPLTSALSPLSTL